MGVPTREQGAAPTLSTPAFLVTASACGDGVRMQLESLTPAATRAKVESGEWVIVDVRPEADFEKAAPEDAINVPLFQAVDLQNATPFSLLRAVAYGLNGVKPVEPNPEFEAQLKEKCAGKKAVMVRVRDHDRTHQPQ